MHTATWLQKDPDLTPPWCSPPEKLVLGSDEVHVWRASLDGLGIQALQATLAADEQRRAERFYFQKDRERFIGGRGLLRVLLGRYLELPPECIQFRYGAHGKPTLPRECSGDVLRFNMSHSQGLALYAVSRGRELGIDIEHLRPPQAEEQIAERFFSIREVATLRGLPKDLQRAAFFACWTRKEAYLKAIGKGLFFPLNQFEVSLVPGEPAALLSVHGDPHEAFRWSLRELVPSVGYLAALAVEGHDWRLKCWQWPG